MDRAVRGRAMPGSDASDFEKWVSPHWAVMHRLAARLCGAGHADDVLQESLAAAWRKRVQFDPDRGSARAWLVAITIDQSRKHRRRTGLTRSVVLVDDPPAGQDTTATHAVTVDMWRAVQQIAERQRLAITLFYYADLPIRDVADVMQCSEGTVKSTLADARRRLGAILGADYR